MPFIARIAAWEDTLLTAAPLLRLRNQTVLKAKKMMMLYSALYIYIYII